METRQFIAALDSADEQELGAIAKALAPHLKNATADRHFQSERITIPTGTAAGNTIRTGITLDSRYSRCTGIVGFVLKSQANPDHQLAIRDNSRAYLEKTSHKIITSDTATPINERFLSVSIPAGGLKIYVETEITSALTADLVFDIVFKLENVK